MLILAVNVLAVHAMAVDGLAVNGALPHLHSVQKCITQSNIASKSVFYSLSVPL